MPVATERDNVELSVIPCDDNSTIWLAIVDVDDNICQDEGVYVSIVGGGSTGTRLAFFDQSGDWLYLKIKITNQYGIEGIYRVRLINSLPPA